MRSIVFSLLFVPFTLLGQLSRQDSIWLPMTAFLGTWEGAGGGEPGIGKYNRSYSFVLGKKFIEVRNKSVYPPTDKNPSGEIHEDVGYISFDKLRRKFVLRQCHAEDFVNQYALDSVSTDGKTMIFVSEAIENIPKGWRAKETYHIVSNNEITETFDLAPPKKAFELYTKVTLKRAK
jgi:hypothetical protein